MAEGVCLLQPVEKHSRQLARIDTQLPAIFGFKKQSLQFCEVLNLSKGGVRIRTSKLPPPIGMDICLHLALVGLRKEVEFCATIVRHIVPSKDTDYQHEFCVEVIGECDSLSTELQNFIDNQSAMEKSTNLSL